jgi:hypothetical protein
MGRTTPSHFKENSGPVATPVCNAISELAILNVEQGVNRWAQPFGL